jgi:hypothetical protein
MQLAKSIIKRLGTKKSGDNLSAVLEEQHKVKVSELFIMPSFNQFLGGRPINEKKRQKRKGEAFIGPILRSGCTKMDEAEIYLLDGTFLGTVAQLKALS